MGEAQLLARHQQVLRHLGGGVQRGGLFARARRGACRGSRSRLLGLRQLRAPLRRLVRGALQLPRQLLCVGCLRARRPLRLRVGSQHQRCMHGHLVQEELLLAPPADHLTAALHA